MVSQTDLLTMIENAVRKGRTLDEACGFLPDMLPVSREQVLRARAAYEVKVGIITQMELPRRFLDPARVTGWYTGPSPRDRFWPVLRRKLLENLPEDVVDSIDHASTRVVSLLPHPGLQGFDSRGMVIGYIQSGKTANFSAVIAKAADVNYKFFIVLSGTQNPLREQTQRRLERELSELNPTDWITLTSMDDDFRPQAAGNANAFLTDRTDQKTLCVIKKNATVMRRLLAWLRSADDHVLRTCPVLVIDDEADVASPNSGPSAERRTAINGLLIELLAELPRVAYVGYTATPFANVFVDPTNPADIYPRDFIVDLPRPTEYFGPERIFGRERLTSDDVGVEYEGLDMVREVPDDEVPLLRPGGPKNRDAFQPEITPSLRDALRYFWMATAARSVRGQGHKHSSMLVHTTMYTNVHERFREAIELERSATLVRLSAEDPGLKADLEAQWAGELRRVPASLFDERAITFDELLPHLKSVVSRSLVVVENGASAKRLVYGDEAEAQIVIGGNTLARGLTLEGLVVSFFVRSATAYDTLLQMGRWFGYRGGYEDLPRIWMTEELEGWFSDLATVEQEIRNDIERYEREGLTPLEFGIRVRRHPQMAITSRLKMQSAIECQISYSGQMVQTILFAHRDAKWLKRNLEAGRELLERLQETGRPRIERGGRVLFLNVPVEDIRSFLSKYQFHEEATQLRADLLLGYIRDQITLGHHDLEMWDVGVVGRTSGPNTRSVELAPGVSVSTIERARIPSTQEYANLKAITSQKDRDLVTDMCEEGCALAGQGDRGLLLLYPIDRDSQPAGERSSRMPLNAVEDVLGVALVFPKSRNTTAQSYFTPDLSGVEREEPEDLEDLEVEESNLL